MISRLPSSPYLFPDGVLEAEKSSLVGRLALVITEGYTGFQHPAEAFRHVLENICRS